MESTANACAALGCIERRRFLLAAALPPVAPPAGVDRNASGDSLGRGRMYDRSIARRPSVRVLYVRPHSPQLSLEAEGASSTRGGVGRRRLARGWRAAKGRILTGGLEPTVDIAGLSRRGACVCLCQRGQWVQYGPRAAGRGPQRRSYLLTQAAFTTLAGGRPLVLATCEPAACVRALSQPR